MLGLKPELVERGIQTPDNCPVCREEQETIIHMLFECHHAKVIWFGSSLSLMVERQNANAFQDWWMNMRRMSKEHGDCLLEVCAIICWNVWLARNAKVFRDLTLNPTETI